MNKKGFVFVETVISLVVFTLFLTITLVSFSLITRKENSKKYYNHVSDRYLLYNIKVLGDNTDYNFELVGSSSGKKITCSGDIFLKDANTCNDLYKKLEIENLYVIDYDSIDEVYSDIGTLENGAIEFIKTLETGNKYLIGVFYRNEKYYYAALRIE